MKNSCYLKTPIFKPAFARSFPYKGKSDKLSLQPKELVTIIEHLIQWYQVRRSTLLAFSIADYIQALLSYCDDDLDSEEYCQYRRLEKKWQYIANQGLLKNSF